ncbi:MAG: hypothetical protein R3293_27370, partial [Candidatus Promineifilaceae bacterium]|nr:hypothetical protein [Candidatus Promineifilaceae bacterium]
MRLKAMATRAFLVLTVLIFAGCSFGAAEQAQPIFNSAPLPAATAASEELAMDMAVEVEMEAAPMELPP